MVQPEHTAELYDPVSRTFTATSTPMTSIREYHTATGLPDGRVLIAGGYSGQGFLKIAELYDPATGTFTATTDPMTSNRYVHTATLLSGGKVLIAGGSNGTALNTTEVYDPGPPPALRRRAVKP